MSKTTEYICFQVINLSPEELKVAETIGLSIGYLSKKATGLGSKMVKIYLAILLFISA